MSLTSGQQAVQTKQLKKLLIQALNQGAIERGLGNPMRYIASLFYDDPMIAVQVLQYIMPKLKSIEARLDVVTPSRLIIQLPNGGQVLDTEGQQALADSMQLPLLEAMNKQADAVNAELLDNELDTEDEGLNSD